MHTKLHRITHTKAGNFCERSERATETKNLDGRRDQKPGWETKNLDGRKFLFFGYGTDVFKYRSCKKMSQIRDRGVWGVGTRAGTG